MHLEDTRNERLYNHPSRLRKLAVELSHGIEKFNFYKGKVLWHVQDSHKHNALMVYYIKEAIQKIEPIMHSIKFKQVKDAHKANLLFCLNSLEKEEALVSGYTERSRDGGRDYARIVLDSSSHNALQDDDHPMKRGRQEGFHYPPGPALYWEGENGRMHGILKTNLNSTADYFEPSSSPCNKHTTKFKRTLCHEILHIFYVDHAYPHKNSREWTQTFYEHPLQTGEMGKKKRTSHA